MGSTTIDFVSAQNGSGATVVRVCGELAVDTIPKISETFDTILDKHLPFVVVDMMGVSLFSSSVLGHLMGYREKLVSKDGDLVLAGLSLEIKSELNLLGANRVFKIYNDVQSAINSYRWDREHISQSLSLSFPSELRFVPAVRQLASRVARQKNYGSRDSFRIETIVDEVCNNAVEHGRSGRGKDVALNLTLDREKIELQVVNETDPDKVAVLKELSTSILKAPEKPGSAVGTDRKRGRGLALIKMLSNDLRIDFSEEGTSVHVTRRRGE